MTAVSTDAPSSAPALVRRRSAWSIADQAVASVASFAVGLLVSRECALPEVGAFAIAFAFYQLLFAVGRPLNSDPLTIAYSAAGSEERRRPAATATGGAMVLGAVVLAIGGGIGLSIGGPTGWALAACAVFAPWFLLQDAWRYVFFTAARPVHALASDALVLLALVPIALVSQRLIGSSGAAFIVGWGAAAATGAVACLAYTRLWPRLRGAFSWWRQTASLARSMLGENLLAMGSYLIAMSIIALAAGADELGRLRVTQVAFAPANFMTLALGTVMLAEGSRIAGRGAADVRRLAAGALTTAASVAGLLAAGWLALPAETGAKVMGSAWPAARPLILPVALYFGSIGVTMVLSMALRALRAARDAFLCRAWAAPLTVAAALGGAMVDSPGLAILAMGVVELACAVAMVLRLQSLRPA